VHGPIPEARLAPGRVEENGQQRIDVHGNGWAARRRTSPRDPRRTRKNPSRLGFRCIATRGCGGDASCGAL
jgi:hypothetical protein